MRIEFKAKDEKGDVQELVVEAGVAARAPVKGETRPPLDTRKATQELFDLCTAELRKAGLRIPPDQEPSSMIKLTLGLLNGDERIGLPAEFDVRPRTDSASTPNVPTPLPEPAPLLPMEPPASSETVPPPSTEIEAPPPTTPPKRKRGRPRKQPIQTPPQASQGESA